MNGVEGVEASDVELTAPGTSYTADTLDRFHESGVGPSQIFFILGGSGLSWQDGAVCEVSAGDTIVQLADREEHTLRAGPDGLDYIVFGTRHPVEYGWLPRSRRPVLR